MAIGAAAFLRPPGKPRATFLELFFDLVFVLALAQLSQALLRDLSWTGVFQSLVMLLALWAVWANTAGLTDRLDPQQPLIQLLVIATMFGALMMAITAPAAFSDRGMTFAIAYVAVQIGRNAGAVLLVRGHEARGAFARPLFWFGVSAVPWIAGAVAQDTARGALWALAVAVEYGALALGLPTPGLGRAFTRKAEFAVSGAHVAERFQQFFILALGELILVTGLTAGRSGFEPDRRAAVVLAFATTALLWRIYIHRTGELLADAIAAAPDPVRALITVVNVHLVMVASIVTIAVGNELVIEHPSGHPRPAWSAVILGGPALFLVGRAAVEYAVFSRISPNRLIGVLLLAAISPGAFFLPPLLVASAPVLVLAGIAVSDAIRARGRPPERPSPPG
ncbi:low temperature requirement protein A [Micromonospora chaiyaphumensis]|uniref:Low temperature requirement protein LtrA n=1 Tax=Micromonospora chaiyaphumensis TaxID=307119 RepID=A0A1C4YCP1_9ACTN|nr:low temperature requirement protein A [Micromonospora chaiyaphumensis]SCF18495.1 Low temperature requirement protein LtrA [Micromonospora chaiyaphumensis]